KAGRRGPIDQFHRRLLWPIKDLGGDVVGFGARRIFDDDQIQAKYLNTRETPIYKKSQVLFGLDMAKREIAKRHQVVVVEGYTDVMAMHLAGVPTAVASCGTAFGTEHISVLRRLLMDDKFFRGEVIYTFDGDEAGMDTDDSTWYPIWWGAGRKAVKWSGATGPQNVFFNNEMTKESTEFYPDHHRIYQFGWNGADYQPLSDATGPIPDWAGHELDDFTHGNGIDATRTDPGPSLFLKN
ncbi:toprim domain-containing protein, partial [Kibdelosporangium lantanae]